MNQENYAKALSRTWHYYLENKDFSGHGYMDVPGIQCKLARIYTDPDNLFSQRRRSYEIFPRMDVD